MILHQAIDSITGAKYTWLANAYDGGAGYPGPNSPTNVLVLAGLPSGSGSGASWHILANVDFTAVISQSLMTNGNYTMGGAVFAVRGTETVIAGGQVLEIVHGSGLRLVCGGSAYPTFGASTVDPNPVVSFPFPSTVVNRVPVRAMLRVGACDADYGTHVYLGVEHPSTTNRATVEGAIDNHASTIGAVTAGRVANGGTFTKSINAQAPDTGTDLIGLWCPAGVGAVKPCEVLAGKYSDGVLSDLNTAAVMAADYALETFPSLPALTLGSASNWGIGITAESAHLDHLWSVFVRQLKVEAYF